MVNLGSLINGGGNERRDRGSLLPTRREEHVPSAINPKEVTKIALKLRYLLENVIPCELDEHEVCRPHSHIITPAVIETASQAGGEENKACVVYCLLICKKWFRRQAKIELWDADMHLLRATAAEIISKRIIESEENLEYLLEHVLLKRFSILIDNEECSASNAIERAADLHALTVIGSSGFQKCVQYLWCGWLTQDDDDPTRFVPYEDKTNTSYWAHLKPDRMRVPRYQNGLQIFFSILYLVLYSLTLKVLDPGAPLHPVEAVLYIFTLGFICEELAKLWKVGRYYIRFWNVFNSTLYSLVAVSFVLRLLARGYDFKNEEYNKLSYRFLAFTAPMFWMRLLLYFDSFRFFGAMLVVVKVMMQETVIFFVLVIFVLVGFFQAFLALDWIEDYDIDKVETIVKAMFNAIMTSPEFGVFDAVGPPFGELLHYIYTFILMVVLLNILIALFNSAYEDISGNSSDEYMALFTSKVLQFTRAPDENVYIAPLNLVEILFIVLPFEWWMPKDKYERLNDFVMGIIYAPTLIITAFIDQRNAKFVRENRRRGEDDEDTIEEWEQLNWKPEVEDEEWARKVRESSPNVAVDAVTLLVRQVKKDVEELKDMVGKSNGVTSSSSGADSGTAK